MSELSRRELLDLVSGTRIAQGNPRVRDITQRVVADLYRAIDDLDIQPDEFWAGIAWLSRLGAAGQVGLVTAGLGFDRLLDIRADEADQFEGLEPGTPRAIEGPLYIPGAQLSQAEARLDEGCASNSSVLVMEGRVLDTDGKPLPGALVDVWHCNEKGRYSHFDPAQPEYNLRRRIQADAQGRYRFRSFLPPGYAIPPNSPVSELFDALGRHGRRPAHIHFLVSAQSARALTTQINIPGDAFINDDFAFATREGLIVQLESVTQPAGYESLGVSGPFTRIRFDFVLQPTRSAAEQKHLGRDSRAQARQTVR